MHVVCVVVVCVVIMNSAENPLRYEVKKIVVANLRPNKDSCETMKLYHVLHFAKRGHLAVIFRKSWRQS